MKKAEKQKAGKKRRLRWKRILLAAFGPVIVIAVIFVVFYIGGLRPGPDGGMVGVCFRKGEMSVSWHSPPGMDLCRLSLYDEEEGGYVLCGEYGEDTAVLTGIEPGKELELQLQALRCIRLFGYEWKLPGYCRTVTVIPEELAGLELSRKADTENKVIDISWQAGAADSYEVYLSDEQGVWQLFCETEESSVRLSFDGGMELPDREHPVRMAARAVKHEKDYVLYGVLSSEILIERSDLLSDQMALEWEKSDECQYVLRWRESKGDTYELQQWSDREEKWLSIGVYDWSSEMRYETGRLPSCTEVRFRVITYDGPERKGAEEYAAPPSEIVFRTDLSALYCTVWPITALDFSETSQGEKTLGQVPAGTALCVLGEEDGRFFVRWGDAFGYVDARFCMIDLTEYLGNLCDYNITNSFRSIFRVHEYDIPGITHTVIKGYENVRLKNSRFLVPYLYPCAQKLYEAAVTAGEDGYRLRIYDAFRPNEATRYLYDTVDELFAEPVPEGNEESEEEDRERDRLAPAVSEALTMLDEEAAAALKRLTPEALAALGTFREELLLNLAAVTPETAAVLTPEEEAAYTALTAEDISALQLFTAEEIGLLKGLKWEELTALQDYLQEDRLTYRKVMTDNRYGLGSFLAAAVSAHNRGIALDLTLVDAKTGTNLQMQTEMHDLSWHSVLHQNNANADLLAEYMKGAGFQDLSSEWWHFQDDETRNAIGLNTYLAEGISAEGWKRDDRGWKYRQEDGSYYRDVTVTLDGKSRTFDKSGYCTDEEPQ